MRGLRQVDDVAAIGERNAEHGRELNPALRRGDCCDSRRRSRECGRREDGKDGETRHRYAPRSTQSASSSAGGTPSDP